MIHLLGQCQLSPRDRIGGGRKWYCQISDGGELKNIGSRGGLFGSDISIAIAKPHYGSVLIPRWENIVGFTAMHDDRYDITYENIKYLLFQVFPDIYTALRYTYHVLNRTYGVTFQHGEKNRMHSALNMLHKHNILAAGLRTGNAEQINGQFHELAAQILKQIGTYPRDQKKRKARVLSVNLADVFDTLGRVNPGAKRAVSAAAMDQLRGRMFDIGCIEPHIIARRMVLKHTIELMELYLHGMYDFLNVLFGAGADPTVMLRTHATRESIVNQLRYYNGQLIHFDIAPFSQTVDHIHRELVSVLQFLEDRYYPQAAEILKRSWNSLKLRQARTELEDVIMSITFILFGQVKEADRTTIDGLIVRLRKLQRQLETVDETGFEHPVVSQVSGFITAGDELLVQKQLGVLGDAKRALKQAACLL